MLGEIRDGLGMSDTEAGVLTSLPVIAFAMFGALAPRLAGWVGPHRLATVALVGVVVGLFGRSRVHDVASFLALSLLALAGMATANVVLPSLVKLHFPRRVGQMTAVYSTSLAVGLTAASVLTVPISQATGTWRDGLAAWSVFALVALVPWLALSRHDSTSEVETSAGERIGLAQVARTRVGVLLALAFGLQSLLAYSIFGWFAEVYRDAGFSPSTAGLLLGVITGTSIPLSSFIPALAGRLGDVTLIVWVLVLCYPVGFVGLILAPHALGWLWAVVIGVATCTFPLVLTLIGLRARTPAGTAALSGFSQSVGYLIAALGPFGFGLLHDLSGGWTVPILGLAVVVAPMLLATLGVAKPVFVEDQLT
ncbi:MFS transporter [Nocardioides mangrovicus]|uniref:MFS transporter n=1 Tax=Nocardioides mangrovicus TaxID=2478913 RepID=A0A3L8P6N3_9ACTN|nr:MFS transporter [Nocardioides mangrovicus]